MSQAWVLIAVLAAVNFAVKATGPVLAGRRGLAPAVGRLVELSVPALVAALVVTGTFAAGRDVVLDARAGGLAAALVAVLLRAPMIVVITGAAGATALLRAL